MTLLVVYHFLFFMTKRSVNYIRSRVSAEKTLLRLRKRESDSNASCMQSIGLESAIPALQIKSNWTQITWSEMRERSMLCRQCYKMAKKRKEKKRVNSKISRAV